MSATSPAVFDRGRPPIFHPSHSHLPSHLSTHATLTITPAQQKSTLFSVTAGHLPSGHSLSRAATQLPVPSLQAVSPLFVGTFIHHLSNHNNTSAAPYIDISPRPSPMVDSTANPPTPALTPSSSPRIAAEHSIPSTWPNIQETTDFFPKIEFIPSNNNNTSPVTPQPNPPSPPSEHSFSTKPDRTTMTRLKDHDDRTTMMRSSNHDETEQPRRDQMTKRP